MLGFRKLAAKSELIFMGDDDRERRIPTHLWIEAEIRRISATGAGVYVLARGDRDSGLVLQKITDLAGRCRLLSKQRGLDGKLVWGNALDGDVVPEKDADDYIRRSVARDPDLWVVEIEDRTLALSLDY